MPENGRRDLIRRLKVKQPSKRYICCEVLIQLKLMDKGKMPCVWKARFIIAILLFSQNWII